MEKKKNKFKSIIVFIIIAITLFGSGVVFAAGFNNFGNIFNVENGIGQTLNNVSGVVEGKLTYIYTERDTLTKTESGQTTLNVIETKSEKEDDSTYPFYQHSDGSRDNDKLRYIYGGYKKSDSDDELDDFDVFLNTSENEPDTIEKLMDFLNGHKNPTCNSQVHGPYINNTCKHALKNFYNFYCLLLDKDIIGWHSYLNRLVDTETYDISRNFNPIPNYDDDDVHVNSTIATDFDDYFEGSKDNQAAKKYEDSWGLVYAVPQTPVPGTYIAIVKENNVNKFWGNFSREKSYDFKKIAQNNTVEIAKQNVETSKYMANLTDFLVDSSYKLPGVDDNLGYRFPTDITLTPAEINKYDVRTNYQRTLSRVSNATYFIYNEDIGAEQWETDKTEYYENPINLYEIDNDGFGCEQDTNTYSYGLAFSRKHEKGLWERAQGTIWAGTGKPAFSSIGVSAGSLDDDIFGGEGAEASSPDYDIDDNQDAVTAEGYNPNEIVLYMAGRALDLYEEKLTGGDSLDNHNDAVSGSSVENPGQLMNGNPDNLNNKVIVSTKGLGTIAADGSINNDFDSSLIGSRADATGTILIDDDHYLIGPFLMSDYVYAASEYVALYSGKDVEKYKTLIGGIVAGELTFSFDEDPAKEVKLQIGHEKEAEIVYENPAEGDYSDKKEEWKAGLKSYSDDGFLQEVDEIIKKENGFGYEFPRPKSTFYIKVEKDACDGAQTLKNIRFVYRQTYSDGDGWVIAARYIRSQWQAGAIEDGCTDSTDGTSVYSCKNVPTDGESFTDEHPDCEDDDGLEHSFESCNGTRGAIEHTDNCSLNVCDDPPNHGCTHTCDNDCAEKDDGTKYCGHEHTKCSGFDCTQRVYCPHGYRYCLHTSKYTLIDGATVVQAQPTLALHKTIVDLRDYCYDAEVNVRLTTDLTINKYIYDVEHCPNTDENKTLEKSAYDSTYPEVFMKTEDENGLGLTESDYASQISREKISENTKEQNPVYVEYGDIVSYHIQLINKQKKDVTVKIYDEIPKNAILLSVQNITEELKTNGVTEESGKTKDKFESQYNIANGSDADLNVILQDSKTEHVKPDDEPDDGRLPNKFSDDQYFTTDWIGVPGRKDGDESNIVTIAVRVKVIDWENEDKWENKVRIITRNSGPKGEFEVDDDYVEDYMRVVDNGKKLSELPGERDTWGSFSKYPPNTRFPLELLNKVTADDRVVNGPVVNLAELDPNVDNKNATLPEAEKLESSDWYKLNNYNAFIDKHVYQYDEKMQQNNNELKYTKDAYVAYHGSGEDPKEYYKRKESDEDKTDVLLLSRANLLAKRTDDFEDPDDENRDTNILDKVRPTHAEDSDKEDRANEKYKKAHPVSVEKTEQITYAIKVLNDSNIIEKEGHISGSKPATQVRTTKITDYLEKGLERVTSIDVEAYIYDKSDNLIKVYEDSSDGKVNVDENEKDEVTFESSDRERKFKKFEYDIDDKTILNPGDYIVYFVTVEVTESNMYLYDLENKANITVLTNINKHKSDDDAKSRVVRNWNDVEGRESDIDGSWEERNENISKQNVSSDFVRLKDLVIAGRVWVDFNRDGYMNEDVEKTFTEESLDPGGIKGNGEEIKDKITKYYSVDKYGRKQGVDVKLYKVEGNTAKLLRTTQTDETGLYTFATKTGGDNNLVNRDAMVYYDDYNYDVMPGGSNIVDFQKDFEWYQRVDKATEKDEYGNYKEGSSKYIDYYIEFEYDGVVYRSTEFYSGEDNINFSKDTNDFGKYDDDDNKYPDKAALNKQIHNDDGTNGDGYTYKYEVDSNAAEFVDKRKDFNKKFEYISYNVTYSSNDDTNSKGAGNSSELEFDKTGHTSQLLEEKDKTKDRKKMTARSFINNATMAGKHGNEKLPDNPNDKKWYIEKSKDGEDILSTGDITKTADLLWLCKYGENEQEYKENPETEYLKHVNLGLELREDVDVDLTKDVYQVKTTVNGEEMVYTYNQNYDREGISNGILNGDRGDTGDTRAEQGSKAYLNDYIVKRPYGLELYESDYKYRVDQYKADAVRKYKEEKSELDIEVTYRITISNKSVWDDETLLASTKPSEKTRKDTSGKPKPEVKDTKLDVKVHEVMDFYDKNFIEYKNDPTQKIISKTKDKDGYLVDKDIIIAEAWYYRKASEGETGDDGLTYYIENVNGRGNNASEKPVYKAIENDTEAAGSETYIRKNLTLKNESGYSKRSFAETPESAGYYKTYISGMDKAENKDYFRIPEGEDRDIYVKYVIDKHDDSVIEITNSEVYNETSTSIKTIKQDGLFEGVHIETESVQGTTLKRSLRIAEQITQKINPRGTENIAQLNAYSVWYKDTDLQASLVDMDSNVGNVGIKNTDTGSVPNPTTEISVDDEDKVPYYEDTVYKTGIEIIANGTENTEGKMSYQGGGIKFRLADDPITRTLSGMVWDDSRSEQLISDDANKDQYIGNGIYNEANEANEEAKINDNVEINYKDESVTEKNDIKVRNVNAEIVEIVEIPPNKGEGINSSENESHYYEEILANVTWNQTQHIRTDEDGNYTLKGFMPGKYIVRFTYGDAEGEIEGETDADGKFVVTNEAQKDMLVFNGQDYKTTQYAYEMSDYSKSTSGTNSVENLAEIKTQKNTIDEYATANTESERGALESNSIDTVLTALERPNLSDARDDEIRRLAVNNYSEIMINEKAEVLKGVANGTELTDKEVEITNNGKAYVNYYDSRQTTKKDGDAEVENNEKIIGNTKEQLQALADNTFMHAETAEFLVKTEKLTYGQTNAEYYAKYIGGEENAMKVYYDLLRNIEFNTVAQRDFKIENIDMGIEYRPETAISLTKEINRVQLITSDNELLVDLLLKTEYGKNGEIVRHYIDTEHSIGFELIQFITNDYIEDDLLQKIIQVDNEKLQGFIYAAVDEDILQGCKVVIQYKFVAQNNSEIDRIADTLDQIRFYGNKKTQELRKIYSGKSQEFYLNVEKDLKDGTTTVTSTDTPDTLKESTEYTANNFARNIVSSDVYSNDENNDLYRDRAKTMVDDNASIAQATASSATSGSTSSTSPTTATSPDSEETTVSGDPDGTNGYFGKYVGYTYFVGGDEGEEKQTVKNTMQNRKWDVLAELKFDKIIDYVDTDLEYGQLDQQDISKLANATPTASTTDKFDSLQGLKNALLNEPINSDISATSNQAFSNISLRTALDYSNILRKVSQQLKKATQGTETTETPEITGTTELENVLKDINGIKYKNIVVTVPDRLFDPDRKSEDNKDTVVNEAFSKFLKPSVLDTKETINSIAEIVLPVSKVLATETDMNNMQYENIAEVVQFTLLTGRRTNFDTTIGNADIHYVDGEFEAQGKDYDPIGSIEFVTASLESDTSSTETITLTPPTGLMRNRRVIREAVDTTTNVIEITVIAIAVVIIILIITKVTIVKIKKKRYK